MLLPVTILREKLTKYQLGIDICENRWSLRVGMRGTSPAGRHTPGCTAGPILGTALFNSFIQGPALGEEKSPPYYRLELIGCQRDLQQRTGVLEGTMRQP